VSGRLIFCDLAHDRYSALKGETAEAFCRLVAGETLSEAVDRLLRPLVEQGLLKVVGEAPAPFGPLRFQEPTSSLLDAPTPWPSPLNLLVGIAAHLRAEQALRRSSLRDCLQRLAELKASRQIRLEPDITAVAPVLIAQRFIPSAQKCLRRSLALATYLTRRNFKADFTIGVRDSRYPAHAWVQAGPVILNDYLDEVQRYVPIVRV